MAHVGPRRLMCDSRPRREESVLTSGRRLVLPALLVTLAITAPAVQAQVLYGSIVGVVKDAQGAAIPAARVERDTMRRMFAAVS